MNPVTDPSILAQLGGNTGGLRPVEDPELLKQLGNDASWGDVPNIAVQGVLDTFNKGGTLVGMGGGKFIEDATGFNPLVELVKRTYGFKTDEEAINSIYDSMNRNSERLKNYFNPQEKQMGLGQSIAGMAGTLPAQLLNVPLAAGERGMSMIDMGESADAAQKATAFDAVANAAGVALPASAKGGMLMRAGTGAGANVAFGATSDQFAKDMSEGEVAKKAFDPFSEEGMKRRAAEAILGATVGAAFGERPKAKVTTPNIGKNLDEFDKPGDVKAIDENLAAMEAKAREENFGANQRMRRRGSGVNENPINVDSQGNAGIDPGAMKATAAIDNQQVVGPQFGGIDPEAARKAEAREQSADTMSLADDSQYPVNDGGSRPVGADGTPLRGMAEDVPTTDFPLRQEVLDSDPVRQMSDFAATHVAEMRTVVDNIWAKIHKQTEFMIDWDGSPEARKVEDANLASLLDELNVAQTQLYAMEKGVRDAWNDFGVTDNYSASGRPIYESRSEPHSRYRRTHDARNRGFAGKQRGFIDPDFFGIMKLIDFVKGVVQDIKSKIEPLRQQQVVEEVQKHAKKLSDDTTARDSVFKKIGADELDLVSRDPSVEDVTKAALDENDVSWGQALSAGTLAKAEGNNSSALKGVYRWWDNAQKRADRFNRDFVKPAAEALKPLYNNKEALGTLKYVFERELKRGSRYTPEQLKAAGLSEKQMEAYSFLRDAFDKAIDVMNAARVAKGKKPINPMDAYMAARWRGPWRATVTDAEGKVIWQIHEPSKYGAQKAMDHIKEKFPDLTISELKYKDLGGRINQDLMGGYIEMLDLLDADDPRVMAVKQLVQDSASMDTVNIFGQEKHFKKKTGVRGFAGDRPWVDSHKDNKDFFAEQLQYVKNAFEWAEKQRAAEMTTQFLADPKIRSTRRNLHDYVSEMAKHQVGIGTIKVFDAFENFVAKSFGTSPQHLDTILGVTKSVFYLTKLGMMNIPFSVAQIIQPIFTAPMHSMWSGDGMKHNTAKTYKDGTLNGMRFVMMHLGSSARIPAIESRYFKTMPTVFKEAALYAEQNGVVDINPLSDVADLNVPPGMKKLQEIAGFNIKYSEQIARASAFMSFVSHLEQSGKFPKTTEGRMKMFQMAEDATKYTMVDYRPSERAMLFQRAGLTGNALSTLNTFKINQVNQMIKYLGEAKKGNVLPAAQFFGAYLMIGGATGFIGIEDADALWQMFLQMGSDEKYASLPKEVREFSIKKALIENTHEWVAFGGVSGLTGIDIYRRFDSSNLMPVDPDGLDQTFSSLFPFAADTYKSATGAASGLGYMLGIHGDKASALAGGYAAMPTAGRGIYEANMPGWKSEETGVYPRPSDPTAGVYARDPEKPVLGGLANEENIRNTGFRSLDEAKTRDIDFVEERQDRIYSKRRASFAKKVRNNIVVGSPPNLEKALDTYFELGGDPESLLADAQIDKELFQRHSSKIQKLYAAAENGAFPAVERLVRYLDAMGLLEDVQ